MSYTGSAFSFVRRSFLALSSPSRNALSISVLVGFGSFGGIFPSFAAIAVGLYLCCPIFHQPLCNFLAISCINIRNKAFRPVALDGDDARSGVNFDDAAAFAAKIHDVADRKRVSSCHSEVLPYNSPARHHSGKPVAEIIIIRAVDVHGIFP